MPNDDYFENVAEPIFIDLKNLRSGDLLRLAEEGGIVINGDFPPRLIRSSPVNFEAAAILMAVEKVHFESQEGGNYGQCEACYELELNGMSLAYGGDSFYINAEYPCPTLLAARAAASPETLKYVNLHLALEKGV